MNWVCGLSGFYVLVSGMGLIELSVSIPDILVGGGVSLIGMLLLSIPVIRDAL
jgi:hypothetical protein